MENNTNPRGFFGVIIPIKLLDNPDLTPGEKIVYAYIASYRKACFDSNDKIAERTGVPERTVRRALSNLTKYGFIYIEFINGSTSKRRIYAILDDPKKLKYLIQKGLLNREEPEGSPQGSPLTGQNGQSEELTGQNGQSTGQNGQSANRGMTGQNGHQRIEENKNKAPDAAGPAKNRPSNVGAPRPKRKDFQTQEEYEKALYAWSA